METEMAMKQRSSHRPPPSGPEGRGFVSPLGGQSNPSGTLGRNMDMSRGEEAKDRVQSPRRSNEKGVFDRYRQQPGRRGR
jgi:hypothetical protein